MRTYLLIAMLLCSTAHAAKPPLPADQWTPHAHLWLSRDAVAESGWLAERDHGLMAWALVYNWREKVKRHPTLRFVDIVRNYCAGLGSSTPSRRQMWIRQLPADPVAGAPEGWPVRASWRVHQKLWSRVQDRMMQWGAGRVRDISGGRVRHWGSPSTELPDIERAARAIEAGKWIELDGLGDTQNTYYGIIQKPTREEISLALAR
jgi:hypothetical protein